MDIRILLAALSFSLMLVVGCDTGEAPVKQEKAKNGQSGAKNRQSGAKAETKPRTPAPEPIHPDKIDKAKSPGVAPDEMQELIRAHNAFTLKLYTVLCRENPGKNIFFSPLAISTALAVSMAGAKDKTAEQMASALRCNLPPDRLHLAFSTLLDMIAGQKRHYRFSIANALWGRKDTAPRREFLQLARDCYGTPFLTADFAKSVEAARKQINDKTKEKTGGKIEGLVGKGKISPAARLIFSSAVYFQGGWQKPFDEKNTRLQPFTCATGEKVETQMMHYTATLGYTHVDGLYVLELPYLERELSMLVFLPEKIELSEFEKNLSMEKLQKTIDQMYMPEVSLAFPKFSIKCNFELTDALSAMGVKDAFSKAADFSGIDAKNTLYLDAIWHETSIEVNEKGLPKGEGENLVDYKCEPAPPVPFCVDRPFLFIIYDNNSGAILFIGRLTNP